MKMDCEVIRDLLPLYVERLASEKSRELVDEHLAECDSCRMALSQMEISEPVLIHNVDPIKKFKKGFRKHTISVVALSAFITVAVIMLIWGLFFLEPGDEMGYCLLNFYFFLPLTAFICSLISGKRESKVKWLLPVVFGVIGGILPYAIFHSMDMIFIFFAFIPSVLGLIIGLGVALIKG